MRKEVFCLYERDLMKTVGGQLFDQAPNREPRKAETIMKKLRDSFREKAYNDNEWYSWNIPAEELYETVEKLLKDIPEFRDLNLSQIEYENGVSVDDEDRPKYSFSSRYDVYDKDSWKDDFVDLDAFVRNVVLNLKREKIANEDCFLCKYEGTGSEKCKNCIVNPKLEFNYSSPRIPKGDHKFACKYDCYRHYYICCEECDHQDNCEHKCDSCSEDCGNAINHIGIESTNNTNDDEEECRCDSDRCYRICPDNEDRDDQ